jgi:hypothetical protein
VPAQHARDARWAEPRLTGIAARSRVAPELLTADQQWQAGQPSVDPLRIARMGCRDHVEMARARVEVAVEGGAAGGQRARQLAGLAGVGDRVGDALRDEARYPQPEQGRITGGQDGEQPPAVAAGRP